MPLPIDAMDPYRKQREQIDAIDQQLLQLLNQRASLALEIGRLKRQRNEPIYVPGRENAVLERMAAHNPGPLPDKTILQLFQTLIAHTRTFEETAHLTSS